MEIQQRNIEQEGGTGTKIWKFGGWGMQMWSCWYKIACIVIKMSNNFEISIEYIKEMWQ